MNMNRYQFRAARDLSEALRKVRDAGLSLYVHDGTVYVCPSDIDFQDSKNPIQKLEKNSLVCTPADLHVGSVPVSEFHNLDPESLREVDDGMQM